MKTACLRNWTMVLALVPLSACYVDVDSGADEDHDSPSHSYPNSDDWAALSSSDSCGLGKDSKQVCSEDGKTQWFPNCKGAACQPVYTEVFYDLEKVLDGRRTVIVEAFDNPRFRGEAVASVWVKGFNAKPGTKMDTELYLGTGIYYLRAYLVTPDELPTPSSYYRLNPSNKAPVGVFGAVSDAEQVIVSPKTDTKKYTTAEIHISHQFEEDKPTPTPQPEPKP